MTQTAPAPMRDPPPPLRQPQAAAVRASWTAAAGRSAAVSLALALFLAVSGAFGLSVAPLWKRLAYWLALLLSGSMLSVAGQAWLLGRTRSGLAVRLAGLAVGMTVVMTPVVFLTTRWMFGGGGGWGALLGFTPPVFAVSAAATALNALTARAREARSVEAAPAPAAPVVGAPAAPPHPAPCARFRERLPVRLRAADIWAVEAEDHYLRVHTDRGSDLLLLRLADALEELAGVEGARTHRSWWVARRAVTDARRGDGRAVLVLPDGTEAPVSRSYAPALREAGWF